MLKPDRKEVDRALEAGEFIPYFQPIVKIASAQLVGFEVLARWAHPVRGVISPNAFIPWAETDGWIGALTNAVMKGAFSCGSMLPHSITLSFNLSPVQLRDLSLPRQIDRISEEAGFSLDRVIMEITESALAQDVDRAQCVAKGLKDLGCRIALDDFGTGYSSLFHLQSLPFDELKVDRSFVDSMTERRESRKIVAAVVGLGQSLGLDTVAEGVATGDQVDMLLWLGCDLGQGWLYGRPRPAEMLPKMLRAKQCRTLPKEARRCNEVPSAMLDGLPAQRLAQLQAVYDGAPVGLGFLDRNLKYVNINRRLANMHGASVEDHFGKTMPEMIPDIFPLVEPFVHRALNGESVADVEVEEPPSDAGPGRTFLVSYQPARDEAGEVIGLSCAIADFTARKNSEEKLREFERVIENIEEMIVVVDRHYRYILANRAFLKYRGISSEQLIGRYVPELIDTKVFEETVQPMLDRCFHGESVLFEMRYNYPELGERDLAISYTPIEISGDIREAACVLRDLTEYKRMEVEQLGWDKRLELAERSGLRLGLWDWDLKANTVVWSSETYRQWGINPAEFSGRVEDAAPHIHPADRDSVEDAIRRVLCGDEKRFSSQYRVVHSDGSVCWIDAHGVMLSESSPRMLGIGVDITDLKMIQESLRSSQEDYLRLLNSAAEAIYAVDLAGKCTFCNPACVRLLGYSTSLELLGKNMHDLMHHTRANGEPYAVEECSIYRPIREGTASHIVDEVLWRADGTSFPVEMWSYPMYKDGEFVGAVVSFLDISERVPWGSSDELSSFEIPALLQRPAN